MRLAAAIVHDPRILILDEPMTGLDPLGRRAVMDLIRARARTGRAVVFSSHILHEVEAVATYVIVLNKGMVLAEGTLEHIREALSDYAFSLEITGRNLRPLAQKLIGREHVTAVEWVSEGALKVSTQSARDLAAELPPLVLELGAEVDVGLDSGRVARGPLRPPGRAEAVVNGFLLVFAHDAAPAPVAREGRSSSSLIALFPAALGIIARYFAAPYPDTPFLGTVPNLFNSFLVQILALFYGASVIRDAIEDRTAMFILTTPTSRSAYVLGVYAALVVHLLLLLELAIVAAFLTWGAGLPDAFSGGVPFGPECLSLMGVGRRRASSIYAAVFMLLGLYTRHSAVVGVVYYMVFEVFLGFGPRARAAPRDLGAPRRAARLALQTRRMLERRDVRQARCPYEIDLTMAWVTLAVWFWPVPDGARSCAPPARLHGRGRDRRSSGRSDLEQQAAVGDGLAGLALAGISDRAGPGARSRPPVRCAPSARARRARARCGRLFRAASPRPLRPEERAEELQVSVHEHRRNEAPERRGGA